MATADTLPSDDELRKLDEAAKHGEIIVEAGHVESERYGAIRRLSEHAPALASRVLAQAEALRKARTALEDERRRHCGAREPHREPHNLCQSPAACNALASIASVEERERGGTEPTR